MNIITFISLALLLQIVTSPIVTITDIPNCQTTTKYQVNGNSFLACTQCQSSTINGVDHLPLILRSTDQLHTDHSQGIACENFQN